MSYMVMECHSSYAILLDEEGRFLKAANLHYKVGQTVYAPVLMRENSPKALHSARWITGSVSAIAACFLLMFGIGYYQDYIVSYSSIYLSINPMVQMQLNRKGTVVSLTGANEDGVALLEGYDGKGKDKVTVADELIDRAIEMGFLSEGGQVSFSIDAPDDALFQEYGIELRSKISEHLDGRITITIEITDHHSQGNSAPGASSETAKASKQNRPAAALPAASNGGTDYSDTDYLPDNDGDDDYTLPTSRPAVSNSGNNDGDSGYTNGNTDYSPQNTGGNNSSDDDDIDDDDYSDDDDNDE